MDLNKISPCGASSGTWIAISLNIPVGRQHTDGKPHGSPIRISGSVALVLVNHGLTSCRAEIGEFVCFLDAVAIQKPSKQSDGAKKPGNMT